MVGAVLNKVSTRAGGYGSYYYYHYGADDGADGSTGWIDTIKGTALLSRISRMRRHARRGAGPKEGAQASGDSHSGS